MFFKPPTWEDNHVPCLVKIEHPCFYFLEFVRGLWVWGRGVLNLCCCCQWVWDVNEAISDKIWVMIMQEELNHFERRKKWELVSHSQVIEIK